MKTWYVLQREFLDNSFHFYTFQATTEKRAWEYVEEALTTNNSQDWLLSKKDLVKLKCALDSGLE